MQTLKKELSGNLMVAMGAVLISFSGVFVKWADVSPTMAGFYRTGIGGAVLLLLLVFRREIPWKGNRCFFWGILCGFVFALDLYFWHKSIHHIGPGLSTIIANFQVFILAIFGIFIMGEKFRKNLVIAIPLAMTGVYLLAGVKWSLLGESYKLGIIMALITALCYATYILILKKLQSIENSPSPIANLTVVSIATALFLGMAALGSEDSFAMPDPATMTSLFCYGLFSQVIGWVLITKGLPKTGASVAGLILLLQPSLAFIWDILFFNRETNFIGGVGAVMAIAAIYMGTYVKKRQ